MDKYSLLQFTSTQDRCSKIHPVYDFRLQKAPKAAATDRVLAVASRHEIGNHLAIKTSLSELADPSSAP
jgi:hypothetical protein